MEWFSFDDKLPEDGDIVYVRGGDYGDDEEMDNLRVESIGLVQYQLVNTGVGWECNYAFENKYSIWYFPTEWAKPCKKALDLVMTLREQSYTASPDPIYCYLDAMMRNERSFYTDGEKGLVEILQTQIL